jgi:uncharacterized RDD family membrane protein YckC
MEKYKTFFPRFVALLIDSFIMLPLAILEDWFRQAEFPPLFLYFWISFTSLVILGYTIMMNGFYGQTLGKMAMNVKILDVSEEPIKFKQAILRSIPDVIYRIGLVILGIVFFAQDLESENVKAVYGTFGTFVMIWGLADIWTFFLNDKRRALHDFIAQTVVVKTNL